MAELPGILPGPFPDGLFGLRGMRRDKGITENLAERILGDAAAAAVLEKTGQTSQVEVLIDETMRARTRAQRRRGNAALSQIADSMGLFERDIFLADDYDAAINESIMSAASFVGPEQKETLAQLAEEQGRAWQQAQFQPSEGLAAMQAVAGKVLELTNAAGDRIRSDFLQPLRQMELEMSGVRQQLMDSSGGNMDARATPQEVLQVLNLLNTQTSQEFGGISVNVPFVGGVSPDDVPNMTYGELLNAMTSHLKGTADYVNQQLSDRGAAVIAQAPSRLVSTPRTDENRLQQSVSDTIEEVYNKRGIPIPEMAEFGTGFNAVETWLQSLPAGTQLSFEGRNPVAIGPDGQRFNPPNSARTLLEQQRRMRARRERRVNQ